MRGHDPLERAKTGIGISDFIGTAVKVDRDHAIISVPDLENLVSEIPAIRRLQRLDLAARYRSALGVMDRRSALAGASDVESYKAELRSFISDYRRDRADLDRSGADWQSRITALFQAARQSIARLGTAASVLSVRMPEPVSAACPPSDMTEMIRRHLDEGNAHARLHDWRAEREGPAARVQARV